MTPRRRSALLAALRSLNKALEWVMLILVIR